VKTLRAYFAAREDPYAGGDLENARQLGGLIWTISIVLMAISLPFRTPTEAIGEAGWVVAGLIIAAGAGFAYTLLHTRLIESWGPLLLAGYAWVVGIAVVQWLGGGHDSPYTQLYLLPVMFVAAFNPPRRIAAFMGAVALALAIPFVYDGWDPDSFASSIASYVIWWAIAVVANILMSGIRAQRIVLAREGEEAREEARLDSLTRLRNRRAFEEAGARELAQARRLEVPLSVMLIDIESFKQVNDRYGHLEGDRCLRDVAAAIRGDLRHPDLGFRWGGDEFALLLPGTDLTGARRLGERLRGAVSGACLRPDEEPVTIRFGVAEMSGDSSLTELVELADLALAAAQRQPQAPEAEGSAH
jgi:diguanylate cyclase (GGDEF)-like protein